MQLILAVFRAFKDEPNNFQRNNRQIIKSLINLYMKYKHHLAPTKLKTASKI